MREDMNQPHYYAGYPTEEEVGEITEGEKRRTALAYSSEHIDGFDSSQDYKVGKVMRVTADKPPTDYVAYNDESQIEGIILHYTTAADLLDRTEKVKITTDDGTKWVVHIRAGPEDRVEGVKTFKFSARELNASSPSVFTQAYLNRFLTKVDLDAEEWRKITSEWIDGAEPPGDGDD